MPFDNPEVEVELNDVTLLLIAGRQRIEQGWVQKKYEEDGSYCALGAIGIRGNKVLTERVQDSCISFLYKFIPHAARVPRYGLIHSPEPQVGIYNDAPGRTQSEILDLFDRAIADSMNCG